MEEKKQRVILSSASLFVFILTLILVIFKKNMLDYYISIYTQKMQGPFDPFFIFLGNYSEMIMIAIALFLISFLYLKKRKQQSIVLFASLTIGYLINSGIKLLVQRKRPLVQLVPETSFSFPSGHSVFVIILFLFIVYLYKDEIKDKSSRKSFIWTNVFIIFLVGFSRIYLNVHWFTDVIAGYALGFIFFNIGVLVLLITSKKFL